MAVTPVPSFDPPPSPIVLQNYNCSIRACTALHARDFVQTPQGICRLHPQLARAVVARCCVAQEALDEAARWLLEQVLAGEARV